MKDILPEDCFIIYKDKYTFLDFIKEVMRREGVEDDLTEDDVVLAYAFTVIDIPCILINETEWNDICDDFKKVVLYHECGHLNGYLDEEEADEWALQYLNEDQQWILYECWEERHGHLYKGEELNEPV
jgi:hypothetical protein